MLIITLRVGRKIIRLAEVFQFACSKIIQRCRFCVGLIIRVQIIRNLYNYLFLSCLTRACSSDTQTSLVKDRVSRWFDIIQSMFRSDNAWVRYCDPEHLMGFLYTYYS